METAESSAEDMEEGAMESPDAPAGETLEDSDDGEAEEAAESRRPQGPAGDARGPEYKAFVTKFDEVVPARAALRRRGTRTAPGPTSTNS